MFIKRGAIHIKAQSVNAMFLLDKASLSSIIVCRLDGIETQKNDVETRDFAHLDWNLSIYNPQPIELTGNVSLMLKEST